MFFVFLAAPFFRRGRKTKRELGSHFGIWAFILLAYTVLRRQLAEPRLASALGESGIGVLWHTIEFTGLFIFGSFGSYVYAAYVALQEHPLEGAFWAALFVIALIAILRSRAAERSVRHLGPRWWIRRALLPGLLFTALGYALSYFSMGGILTYPMTGRDTRFSLAAEFGSSIFAAGLWCFAIAWIRTARGSQPWLMALARIVGIASYGLFVVYAFMIQGDYIGQWKLDQNLLAGMIAATPDATPDTLLILQQKPIVPFLVSGKRGPAIGNQSHALQYSYRRLFGHGKAPEIFEVFGEDWKHYLQIGADGALRWTAMNFKGGWARDTKAPIGPIILLLERPGGSIERVDAPIVFDGKQVNRTLPAARPGDSSWNRLARSPLVKFVLPDLIP